MSKIKAVWELFDETSRKVSRNGKEWADYLKFASRIYKYNFDNALQIYGQNRDATMLAEREIWENRIGRTINKEYTNIAVFDVMSAKPQLRYLIDISDTSGDEKTYPRLWRLTSENSQLLLERLKRQHPADVNTVYEYIDSEVLRRVREIRPGFYDGIKRNTEGSPLFKINDGELESKVNVMVWNGAAYMMYSRCGFDTSGLDGQFEDISDFNNKSLLYRMGNCATIIARDFLSECATSLNQLAKERREQTIREKNNTEPQIAPPASAKRRISENIRKGAVKTAEVSPAQLSIFGNTEEAAETVDVSSESDEISDDDVIKSIASYGSLIAGGKQRINEFFQSNTGWKDRENFLKNEYGICGASVTVDDMYYSWMADGKGIEYHARENTDNKKRITWNSFAKYVQESINEGTYYIPEPKAEIQETESADEAENIKPDFKYGDFISLNGDIFEVLESDEKERTTDLGDILKKGEYCQFCKGTYAKAIRQKETHNLDSVIDGQIGNNRFYLQEECEDCGYKTTEYITAKSVVTSYYGNADNKPHTVTVSDLSDSGVHTSIRYGTSAGKCNFNLCAELYRCRILSCLL